MTSTRRSRRRTPRSLRAASAPSRAPPTQKISALVLVKGQLSSPDEFGAIILRANPDGSTVRLRDVARHRDRRPELSVQHAPQRQADRGPFRAAVADRQRARHRQRGRSQDEGAVALLPGQHRLRNSLQHHARGEGLDREGAVDAGRSRGAGLHRDVPVPAEHPLHHHPDHRGPGGAARYLRDRCCSRAIPSTC